MLLGEVLAEGQGACRRVEPSQALPSSENYLEATAESFPLSKNSPRTRHVWTRRFLAT